MLAGAAKSSLYLIGVYMHINVSYMFSSLGLYSTLSMTGYTDQQLPVIVSIEEYIWSNKESNPATLLSNMGNSSERE